MKVFKDEKGIYVSPERAPEKSCSAVSAVTVSIDRHDIIEITNYFVFGIYLKLYMFYSLAKVVRTLN